MIAKFNVDAGSAYGSKGIPGRVPPDSEIVYLVELLDVVEKGGGDVLPALS